MARELGRCLQLGQRTNFIEERRLGTNRDDTPDIPLCARNQQIDARDSPQAVRQQYHRLAGRFRLSFDGLRNEGAYFFTLGLIQQDVAHTRCCTLRDRPAVRTTTSRRSLPERIHHNGTDQCGQRFGQCLDEVTKQPLGLCPAAAEHFEGGTQNAVSHVGGHGGDASVHLFDNPAAGERPGDYQPHGI
ncbi:hypothetical protein D3C76_890900 [compost metagenome]